MKSILIENLQPKKGKSHRRYDVLIVPGKQITIRTTTMRRTDVVTDWLVSHQDYKVQLKLHDLLSQEHRSTIKQLLDDCQWPIVGDLLEDLGCPREWATGLRITVGAYRYEDVPVETMYEIGDEAEYDSYNLHYLGRIKSITAKSVVIAKDDHHDGKTARLSLHEFAWRNYSGIESKRKTNTNWMD